MTDAFAGAAWKELLTRRETAKNLRMPNLFGVGAARCGTTSLYHILKKCPDIHTSPVKELVFFSHKTLEANPRGWTNEEYMLFFSDRDAEAWAAEVSPHYMHDPAVPDRIKSASPDARVIIQFREPVSRMKSHFRKHAPFHKVKRLDEYVRLGLKQLAQDNRPARYTAPCNNLRQSFYATEIRRYLDVFGEDNVAIIHLDHLNKAPWAVSAMLSDFLGVPVDVPASKANASRAIEGSGSLAPDILGQLQQLYQDDYQQALNIYEAGRFVPHQYGAPPVAAFIGNPQTANDHPAKQIGDIAPQTFDQASS
jgi:Sulfotransferase domain